MLYLSEQFTFYYYITYCHIRFTFYQHFSITSVKTPANEDHTKWPKATQHLDRIQNYFTGLCIFIVSDLTFKLT